MYHLKHDCHLRYDPDTWEALTLAYQFHYILTLKTNNPLYAVKGNSTSLKILFARIAKSDYAR